MNNTRLQFRNLNICLKALLIACALFHSASTYSQKNVVPPLERMVSIKVRNTTIRVILQQISESGKFSFSYSEKAFNAGEKISLNYSNKSVRFILNKIFKGRITYKIKGEYIILVANGHAMNGSSRVSKETWINGYIIDSTTMKKIPDATIYDSRSLASANTDAYGYFSFKFPNDIRSVTLQVRKKGYFDNRIQIDQSQFQSVEIYIRPKLWSGTDSMHAIYTAPSDDFEIAEANHTPLPIPKKLNGISFLLNNGFKTNLKNVGDQFFRQAQFSFLPGVGTNKLIGGNVVNNYSLNILAGYSLGVNKAEFAGILNIDRGNVRYLQGAGFANIVGGKFKGVQASGFMNIVGDSVSGIQGSGFININGKHTKGIQASGFYNQSQTMNGMQGSGFCNLTLGKINGLQGSGAVNICGSCHGIQVAGMCNISSHDMEGIQAAGLFNYAKNLKHGIQLAPFNFADSCEGIPIGIFNFVRYGYHKIELSADEIFPANLAFRSGVKKFHSIFTVGIHAGHSNPLSTMGYGIGTTLGMSKKLDLDVDLISNTVVQNNFANNMNYNKINIGIDWQAFKKISFSIGPSFNFYIQQNTDQSLLDQNTKISYQVDQHLSGTNYLKGWLGAKVAVRFL